MVKKINLIVDLKMGRTRQFYFKRDQNNANFKSEVPKDVASTAVSNTVVPKSKNGQKQINRKKRNCSNSGVAATKVVAVIPKNRIPIKCSHNKRRNQCKDCGGSSICVHGRRKAICKDCVGNSICIHKRQKNTCIECGGKGRCIHGKLIRYCSECSNNSHKCIHGLRKQRCQRCGGSDTCVHVNNKYQCRFCSKKCEHGLITYSCKECRQPPINIHFRYSDDLSKDTKEPSHEKPSHEKLSDEELSDEELSDEELSDEEPSDEELSDGEMSNDSSLYGSPSYLNPFGLKYSPKIITRPSLSPSRSRSLSPNEKWLISNKNTETSPERSSNFFNCDQNNLNSWDDESFI